MGDFFDKFSKVPLSQKVLLLLLVLAAVGIAFYMFVYSSLEEELANLQEQEAAVRQQVSRRKGLEDQRDAAQASLAELEASPQEQVTLPGSDDIALLYKLLEDVVKDVQDSPLGPLELATVSRSPYLQGPDYTRIPINLSMRGTYDQILEYCWRLATLDRIIHVRSVSLSGAGGSRGTGAPMLSIALSIEAFFRPGG